MNEQTRVLREHGYHRLRVAQVIHETEDARSFVLEVPDDVADLFGYRPGQFCTFRFHIDGEEQLRSYSMSSAPVTDRDLTVTVKRVPGGLVSNHFIDRVSVGDPVELTKPAGVFCPQEGERPVVAFCGGSGITPVMSIAKHTLAATGRPVRLLYANRDRSSVIFEMALTDLAAAHRDRLEVRHHIDAETGLLTPEDVERFVGGTSHADFYVCGPGPFMDLVESALARCGVPPERIFIERFLVQQQEKEVAAEAAGDPDTDTDAVPAEVTVVLNKKKVVVTYQRGDTLLETARRGGLRPPFSCESGNCATCMAMLREGGATMRANNALTPEEVEEGWILTCQGVPKGDKVTVEYEAM